jgi:hypothetical protein
LIRDSQIQTETDTDTYTDTDRHRQRPKDVFAHRLTGTDRHRAKLCFIVWVIPWMKSHQ